MTRQGMPRTRMTAGNTREMPLAVRCGSMNQSDETSTGAHGGTKDRSGESLLLLFLVSPFGMNAPVHMTAANTQHWPYLTGLFPVTAHILKMSPLPVHVLGWTPCLKSLDQFPFNTPLSSSLLICARRTRQTSRSLSRAALPSALHVTSSRCVY